MTAGQNSPRLVVTGAYLDPFSFIALASKLLISSSWVKQVNQAMPNFVRGFRLKLEIEEKKSREKWGNEIKSSSSKPLWQDDQILNLFEQVTLLSHEYKFSISVTYHDRQHKTSWISTSQVTKIAISDQILCFLRLFHLKLHSQASIFTNISPRGTSLMIHYCEEKKWK